MNGMNQTMKIEKNLKLFLFFCLLCCGCNNNSFNGKSILSEEPQIKSDSSSPSEILHLKIVKNYINPSLRWGRDEIVIKCLVLSVLKENKINVNDTIIFSQTIFRTQKDTLEKILQSEKIRVGTEYIAFLEPRKKGNLIGHDSIFVHINGVFNKDKSEKKDEYKMIKIFCSTVLLSFEYK